MVRRKETTAEEKVKARDKKREQRMKAKEAKKQQEGETPVKVKPELKLKTEEEMKEYERVMRSELRAKVAEANKLEGKLYKPETEVIYIFNLFQNSKKILPSLI